MAKLTETLLLEGAADAGLIKNVKILGANSRNKRRYTPEAMREAVTLYEGAIVNVDHGVTKNRPLDQRFGRLKNVRFDAAKSELRGDLEHLTSHPAAGRLKEDLERGLGYFGLSHDADGQFRVQGGIKTVTKIDKVNSVDLVTNPATAISLLEQEDATAAVPDANAGPDPKLEALRAGLNAILDKGGDVATVTASITEFLETMKDAGGKSDEGKKPEEGAQEQVTAASIGKLVEQAVSEALKKTAPRKYGIPAAGTKTTLTEQTDAGAGARTPTDAPPKDKAALKKWLKGK